MAVKMSKHLATEVLKAIMKGETLSYSTLYISLHDGVPNDDGSNEVVAGDYSYYRKEMVVTDWATPVDGSVESDIELLWTNMPAVTVSHIGLWDTVDGGTFLWAGELNEPVTLSAGDAFIFNEGDVTAEIDPA